MKGIAISRKTRKLIKAIYEHPDNVYSIDTTVTDDTIWVCGKYELYQAIRKLERERISK